jgi:hypothetical protein
MRRAKQADFHRTREITTYLPPSNANFGHICAVGRLLASVVPHTTKFILGLDIKLLCFLFLFFPLPLSLLFGRPSLSSSTTTS